MATQIYCDVSAEYRVLNSLSHDIQDYRVFLTLQAGTTLTPRSHAIFWPCDQIGVEHRSRRLSLGRDLAGRLTSTRKRIAKGLHYGDTKGQEYTETVMVVDQSLIFCVVKNSKALIADHLLSTNTSVGSLAPAEDPRGIRYAP